MGGEGAVKPKRLEAKRDLEAEVEKRESERDDFFFFSFSFAPVAACLAYEAVATIPHGFN